MNGIKTKTKKILIFIAALIVAVASFATWQITSSLNAVTGEKKAAMSYGELTEEDYATQSENVEFAAFFLRDLNNDGNADPIKGTAKQIGTSDTLYAELKVSTGGCLRNGQITLNAKNMSWQTAIVADNIVARDYISNSTTNIQLANEVYAGSQKLFMGQISSNIGSNINDYSQINSMTLTGIYVDDNGQETPISVTREFTVDWYGYVSTDITSDNQELNLSIENNQMQIAFKIINKEENGQLILKENVVEFEAPELNGYKATNATVSGGQNYTFDQETGIVRITKQSNVDSEGRVSNAISRLNTYSVILTYPAEAHGDETTTEELFTKIEVPVTATYTGYNNQKEYFSPTVSSTDHQLQALVEKKGVITKDKDALDITIGKKVTASKYVVSKESAVRAYNGNEIENENYDVTWYYVHADKETDGNIVMNETSNDEAKTNRNASFDISQYVTVKGVWFSLSGSVTNLSVYNDETNELLYTFATRNDVYGYGQNNPYLFEDEVKKIRVEIQSATTGTKIEVHQIKEIDNTKIINNVTKEEFDALSIIYSHLTASGKNFSRPSRYSAYAKYSEEESEVKMSISNSQIQTQNLSFNENITITTSAEDYNQRQWKNGTFLVQFPKDIISSEITDVIVNSGNVKILGYDLYKENGNYFAKILTENGEPSTYSFTIKTNNYINPIATTQSELFTLYAYNEDCYTYTRSIKDTYDINGNNSVEDEVGTYTCSMGIVAPESVLTSQTASNYDEDLSIVIAPSKADVKKTNRTADINVNILNNYTALVSDTKILGTIPYQGNTYISSDVDLESEYSVVMSEGGIKLPAELEGKVKVYYTENGSADIELDNEENGWTLTPSDWTKVKRYLIDFGNNNISSGKYFTFTYTITLPEGLEYNQIAYSEHEIYCALVTSEGKYPIQLEPSKLGIRIARKYNLEITKLNRENGKLVPGASYQLTEYNKNNEKISSKIITTNNEGKLIGKNLYVDSTYTLQEIRTPANYMLNNDVIKFITRENNEGNLEVEVLSEAKFKLTPEITNDTLISSIDEDPRYQVLITKLDKGTREKVSGVRFQLEETNETYITNAEGQIKLDGLDQNEEYTLKELYADGYYLMDDVKFKVVKGNNGFRVESENTVFANAQVEVKENEDLLYVELELENDRQPSLQINKKDSETGAAIEGVRFSVDGRLGKVYTTDENGQTVINGFEENKDYTLREVKATGYYLQEVTFRIVRDANNNLKVESQNQEFANAQVTDAARKILTVEMNNNPIPSYDLEIVKLSEGTDDKVLKGAKFNLASQDDNTIKEYITDENGKITVKNLYAYVEGKEITGNYTLQETEAPRGYSNNAEQIKFKVIKTEEGYDIQVQNEENLKTLTNKNFENGKLTLTIEDKPLFTLTKVDKETGEPLANVGFVIMELSVPPTYAKDINGDYVGTLNEKGQYIVRTDENGKITLPLKNGKYTIWEVEYPEGYEEDTVMQVFEVTTGEEGQTTKRVTEIRKIEDLVELSNQVNNGDHYENVEVKLMNTLDFNNDEDYNDPNGISYGDLNGDGTVEGIKTELTTKKGFTAIGVGETLYFSGIFDGDGKKIRNIHISGAETYGGLFGCIRSAEIKNLGITGSIINKASFNSYYTGAIAGYADNSRIEKCYNKANIDGGSRTGGIVGFSSSTIVNCYNTGNITSLAYNEKVGGIVGEGKAINCYNIGNVTNSATTSTYKTADAISTSVSENCYYLDSITVSSGVASENGTAKTSEYMKTQDFVNDLNKYAFKVDTENVNNGYPIINYDWNERITNIEYVEDLVELANQLNRGVEYKGTTVTLINDLDFTNDANYRNPESTTYGDINEDGTTEGIKVELTKETGKGFCSIGNTSENPFDGIFDGNEKTIRNIYINRENEDMGFFGNTDGATIKNLTIDGKINARFSKTDSIYQTATTYITKNTRETYVIGGLIANSENSTIDKVTGKIDIDLENTNNIDIKFNSSSNNTYTYDCSNEYYIGGLIGKYRNLTMTNSTNEGNINGDEKYTVSGRQYSSAKLYLTVNPFMYIGGIAGGYVSTYGDLYSNNIDGCCNKGNINIQKTINGTNTNVYSFSFLTRYYLAGIDGSQSNYAKIAILNSKNEGNITINDTQDGDGNYSVAEISGIGQADAIQGCYNKGNIETNSARIFAHGISKGAYIENCYNCGNITNTLETVPDYAYIGLAGIGGNIVIGEASNYSSGSVRNSYNIGNIKAPSTKSAVAATCMSDSRNCYYLDSIELTGETVTESGSAKTSEYMKSDEFINELNPVIFGKDTENVNNGYPIFAENIVFGKKEISINYIEDLVDLKQQTANGEISKYTYSGLNITLERTIDFNDDNSYKNPLDTSYGDLNEDGEIEGIKAELTKADGIGFKPISGKEYITSSGGYAFEKQELPIVMQGNGNEIKNIYINSNRNNIGLFGYVEDITIENLTISGNIKGYSCTGGFIGQAYGGKEVKLINCHNDAKIENGGSSDVGGLVGCVGGEYLNVYLENCHNSAKVENTSDITGGLIGYSSARKEVKIENCYNTGDISGKNDLGGLIGEAYDSTYLSIKASYNEGSINGEASLGGIVGYMSTSNRIDLENCYNTGDINSNANYSNSYAGGLIGNLYSKTNIDNCYNTGNVIIENSNNYAYGYAGGLIGYTGRDTTIKNSYNSGSINDVNSDFQYSYLGGLVANGDKLIITGCHNIGEIRGSRTYSGGLVGYSSAYATIADSYNAGNIISETENTKQYITGYTGGIVGRAYDGVKIKNAFNTGTISVSNTGMELYWLISGISAYEGDVEESYNTGDIIVKGNINQPYVSGIINRGPAKKSYNTGNIFVDVECTSTGTSWIGGICSNYGKIEDCYNTGNIRVNGTTNGFQIGGIEGYGDTIKNVYNTGNIEVNILYSSYSTYVGGITGYQSATLENAYNTGNIDVNIISVQNATYIGGINGYEYIGNNQQESNLYNSGNINIKAEGETESIYGAGIYGYLSTYKSILNNIYNAGDVTVDIPNESTTIDRFGKIASVVSMSDTSVYNTGYLSTMKFDIDSSRQYTKGVVTGETEVDSSVIPDIKSEEFYNTINTNGVWTRLEGMEPKLMVNTASQTDSTSITVDNTIKTFIVTTDIDEVNGTKGGTITGEDQLIFEQIKYGKSNTKEIVMTPNEGYKIVKITVNDKEITFVPQEDGTFTMSENYFTNVQEDKHVVVTYGLAEQILTLNKIDADTNEPVQGAKFKVESATTPNEILGKLTNNGDYYFEDSEGKLIPNNAGASGFANSYIPIDLRNQEGEYYVVVNANSNTGTMVAQVSENTAPITTTPYYSNDVFMFVNGGSAQGLNYTSDILEGGKMYYLKLASTSWSTGSQYDSEVNSVRLFKKEEDKSNLLGELTANNATRTFEKNGDKIELTSGTEGTEGAQAYVEIDLTNKTGTYNVILDAETTLLGGSIFKASIKDTTTANTDYSPYNQFVYVNTSTGGKYVSEPLEGGKRYYLQLSYSGGNKFNEVVINSITLAKSAISEIFYNNNGEESTVIEENEYFGKITENPAYSYDKGFILDNGNYVTEASNPSTAYIEVDLTEKTGKYNVLMDVATQNSSSIIATITKDKASVTDGSPYNHFVYISGTNEFATYASKVLEGGEKYYIQIRYMGGGNPKAVKIGKIELVENTTKETFGDESNEILGSLENNGDYYFEYTDGKLVPNNVQEGNTALDNANSYIPINLTGKTGRYAVVIKAESKSPTMVATVSEDTNPITENISSYNNSNNVFMWVNPGSPSYGVEADYTYVSKPLSGGQTYYLKLVSQSRREGENYAASVNSIELIELTDSVETFKNNKGDKFVATDLVTDENGKIQLTVPHIGKYVITETGVPEGYTKLAAPIVTTVRSVGENSVTIENKAKQKVIVHHYFKNSEGEYTTIKVAEDEVSTYNVGEKYTTAPKVGLENLELEKNLDGTYKVPENASGEVGEFGNEVTYYYEEKTIELTIHHYSDKTGEKLAEDESIEYNPTVSVENNIVVDVSTDQTYGVKSNNSYRTLLSRNYSATAITQDNDVVEDEEIEFNNNSELTYYYDMLEGTVTAKYVDKNTGDEIAESETTKDLVGKNYTVSQKTISGYTFVERDGDLTGTYQDGEIVVTFYYKQNAQVTVNHIDKDTNQVLDTKVHTGVVGDEFTSSSSNFRYYVLVERPTNETVTMTPEEIVLNYYYRKISVGLIEKHVDQANNDILYNETHTLQAGSPYKIDPREFEGYDLVETRLPDNAEGTMTDQAVEVIYYYSRQITVIAKYIDTETKEKLAEDVTKNGHEGDRYTTQAATIDDYELVSLPENSTGTMAPITTEDGISTTITVVYEYRKTREKAAGVVERHIDVDTNKLLEPETTYKGYVGDEYVTTAKDFEGYDLVESRLPENSQGTMTDEVITIDYYYSRKIKVVVKYEDIDSKVSIAEDVIKNGHVGDEYTTEAKEINNYELKETPTNANGIMQVKTEVVDGTTVENTTITVVYKYQKIDATVVEKHYDIKSNKLLGEKIYDGKVGDNYETTAKSFVGYDIVTDKLPTNSKGTMTKEPIEVNYYYIRKVTLTVEYKDKITDEDIKDPDKIPLHEDDKIKPTPKPVDGYDVVEKPEDGKEITVKEDTTVVFYYKRKAVVEVKYLEKETGKELADTITINGHVGDEYTTEEKEIEYYELVEKPANAKGVMTVNKVTENGKERVDNTTEVIYYYKALDFNIKVDKEITKLTIDGKKQNIPNGKLAKLEIHRKKLDNSDVVVEYTIKVSNIGEVTGNTTVEEDIPEGFTVDKEASQDWKVKDGKATVKVKNIKPGEEQTYKIVLNWKKGEKNIGTKINTVKLTEENNKAGFKDSNEDDNTSSAILLLTIATGVESATQYIIAVLILSSAVTIVILLKRKK